MRPARWRHPVVRQWSVLVAALLSVTAWGAASGFFWRFDLSLYDASLPMRPAPSDIVIVAVDDASIAELGRWPWDRVLHAALIDRLRELGAKAVALDFLLTEPDVESPQGDIALAQAMARGPPTILPLSVEMPGPSQPLRERLPIPILAQAAAGIGHADLELDRDGVVRSVFLREGIGTPDRPHFAVALLDSIPHAAPLRLQGARHPDLARAPAVWVRDYRILIPFIGPPGHFTQVSYVDVLRGSVPRSAIDGKLVLVGATAQGIGDAYPTPRSGEGLDMSGIEITANVLQALRSDTAIRPLPLWTTTLIALIPVLLAAFALLLLAPRQSLLVVAGLTLGTLGASVLTLRLGNWWWPPSASLAVLLVSYPLWSWRRLEATQKFLAKELSQLASERFPLLSRIPSPSDTQRPIDFLEQRIELLRHAIERLRSVRRLFADTIGNLPDATLLIDVAGRIVLANPAAAGLFGTPDHRDMEDKPIDAYLYARTGADAVRFAALAVNAPCTIEAKLKDTGRHALIRAVPFCDSALGRAGTIVAVADITELRAVQRERDDVLRFLSHDMKSPASSLLGLAQLQRDPSRALPPDELSQRLDLLAQRLLTLVDGFVSLARAESTDTLAFDDFDLRDAIQDAYDEVWATAQARGISIVAAVPEDSVIVHGDRHLLARTIANLLNNAVKFSPKKADVTLTCQHLDGDATVKVADQGPGIAPENVALVFRRFTRGLHRGTADPGGAGLGLAFVRVVVEKHGGRVLIENNAEQGVTFLMSLPIVVRSVDM
jgi:CHASE2 domain-containing sensor protein/signal transduction histidine kinase